MSELKHQLMLNKDRSWVPCYLKSEADKVIAEKDKKIAEFIEKNKRLACIDLIMASETIKDLVERHKKEVEQLLIEIEEIVKGAISMFRLSDNCRGLDLKSPLGRIANTAFKHWCFVESIQNKNQQLQEDKERLLHNNHHLLDEVERLKADYKEACGRLQTANLIKDEKLAEARHHKYKRCLAMAKWCMTEYLHSKCLDFTNTEQWYWRRWHIRWRNLAKKFKEDK